MSRRLIARSLKRSPTNRSPAAAFLLVATMATLPACGASGPAAPNVEGKTLDVAENELRAAGLSPRLEEREGTPATLTVCDQEPPAGDPTDDSRTVRLSVAQDCAEAEEDSDRRKRKSSGSRKRR